MTPSSLFSERVLRSFLHRLSRGEFASQQEAARTLRDLLHFSEGIEIKKRIQEKLGKRAWIRAQEQTRGRLVGYDYRKRAYRFVLDFASRDELDAFKQRLERAKNNRISALSPAFVSRIKRPKTAPLKA